MDGEDIIMDSPYEQRAREIMSGRDFVEYTMPDVMRLNPDLQSQWLQFKLQFQEFLTKRLENLFETLSETSKLNIFFSCVGIEVTELYFNVLKTEETTTYADIIKRFDDYFARKQNVMVPMFHFNQRHQQVGETFDAFYTEIRKLIKNCNCREEERLLRDKIVVGVQDKKLQQKLLENDDLTLQEAVDICRASELSKKPQDQPSQALEPVADQENDKVYTVTEIMQDLKSVELPTKTAAYQAARRMLMVAEGQEAHIASLVEAGIIPLLIADIKNEYGYLQLVAVGVLARIAGDRKHTRAVVDAEEIPLLVMLLSCGEGLGEEAARALGNIALESAVTRDKVLEQGGLSGILPELSLYTPTWQLRTYVLACRNLCSHDDPTVEFELVSPCLPLIADLLTIHDEQVLEHACWTLYYITRIVEHIEDVVAIPNLVSRLLSLLDHSSVEIKTRSLTVLANMLAHRNSRHKLEDYCFSDENFNLIHRIIYLLDHNDNYGIQYAATRVLASIASGYNNYYISNLADCGAIPTLVSLMPRSDELAELAARALVKLAGHYHSREVMECGALPALLPYLRPDTPIGLLRSFVKSYRRICWYNTYTDSVPPGLSLIADLLTVQDEEVLTCSCSFLYYLTNRGYNFIMDAVQAVPSLTAHLITLLGHNSADVKKMALRVVTNMLGGTDSHREHCLDAGCLDEIITLLRCINKELEEEAACAAAYILRGTHAQIQRTLDHNPSILWRLLLQDPDDTEFWKLTVLAISNLCVHGTAEQLKELLESSTLKTSLNLHLRSSLRNAKRLHCFLLPRDERSITEIGLTGLYHLLQKTSSLECGQAESFCMELRDTGVLDVIKDLQENTGGQVKKMATEIIATYFSKESGDTND